MEANKPALQRAARKSHSLSLLSDRRLGPAERHPRHPVKNPRSIPCPRSTRDIPLKNPRSIPSPPLYRQTDPATLSGSGTEPEGALEANKPAPQRAARKSHSLSLLSDRRLGPAERRP